MWNGKKKAITFSFDDGITQDIRLVAILNKYGLKGTFNLNSERFSSKGDSLILKEKTIPRMMIGRESVSALYSGHEIAVHTLTHVNLTMQTDGEVIRQVDEDRKNLEKICGYPVVGMAYPCGGVNNDERVAELIKENTPIRYARTITSSYTFDLQKEHLLRFNPTLHFLDEKTEALVEEFLALQPNEPQLLYIWGHSYELDVDEGRWERFGRLCARLAGKEDIFYGTNKEVLL